ncbi:hypothetical protein OPU71_14815 [Niveibacterium sp. 24ML]|uniref:hypothetical protein n=1 Tax=Niveibacterium sp. 24ML TaxID=2985512 RepID=UPI0022713C4A|nr:hypothetical protein [Niveibacterium sp. 24ML]MCX9157397.1 hypothetical protein [Niveibacterium sp. 24ML]
MSALAEAAAAGYFDGAQRAVNFFAGRLLSGRDLADEQAASAERDAAIATAAGTGIARGLVVTRSRSANGSLLEAVDLSPGTAIAPDGTVLRLASPLRIQLAPDTSTPPPPNLGPGAFRLCGPKPGGRPGPSVRYGTALQVLLVGPAQALSSEQAPGVSGAGSESINRCGARWRLNGLRFRLATIPVALLGAAASTLADTSTLGRHRARHIAAFAALGGNVVAEALVDPLGGLNNPLRAYGLLDAAGVVADDEVPLALFGWQPAGLAWLDMWAVRRTLHEPASAADLLLLGSGRRAAEGMAFIRQFAQQAAELIGAADYAPTIMTARNVFAYLPPVGVLPIASATRRGIQPNAFFSGLAVSEDDYLDGALLEPLWRGAAMLPPIDLASEPQQLIWRFRLRGDGGAESGALLFGHRHLPLPAASRENRARFDHDRYPTF